METVTWICMPLSLCISMCVCVLYIVYAVRNNEEFAQTGIPTFFKQGERGQTVLRTLEQTYSATNRTLFPSQTPLFSNIHLLTLIHIRNSPTST